MKRFEACLVGALDVKALLSWVLFLWFSFGHNQQPDPPTTPAFLYPAGATLPSIRHWSTAQTWSDVLIGSGPLLCARQVIRTPPWMGRSSGARLCEVAATWSEVYFASSSGIRA